ncbi:DUF2892 family protein [Melghiribacillus thermohalophilus]|uniref:DUF2892 family protein n=1 Tax=Melghiribacillus thermohalophilus TaxID=1324956 RepID=A0A4R3MT71_9BACI|nr:DUF2892 domain-containing protein [Melghiribacillus thermohalophilus]TCT18927.1 DUF2892 family protein [Melghiribacillus thermohalophilus]
MVKQNIGVVNSLIRITCGLTGICYGMLNLQKRPWQQGNWTIITLSAMKVGEGIVRFCPVTYLLENQMTTSGQSHGQGNQRLNKQDSQKSQEHS